MAITYKVLGQISPSAGTANTLYTVPSGTSAVTSTISVCNQNASAAAYRIAVRPAGETLANKHYIAFDSTVPALDSISLTIGVTLAATDVVTVYANTTNISFNPINNTTSLFGLLSLPDASINSSSINSIIKCDGTY